MDKREKELSKKCADRESHKLERARLLKTSREADSVSTKKKWHLGERSHFLQGTPPKIDFRGRRRAASRVKLLFFRDALMVKNYLFDVSVNEKLGPAVDQEAVLVSPDSSVVATSTHSIKAIGALSLARWPILMIRV